MGIDKPFTEKPKTKRLFYHEFDVFQINYVERNQKKISVKNALSPNFVIVQKTTKSQNLQHKKFNLPERCNFIVTFFLWALFLISEKQRVQIFYIQICLKILS